MGDDLVVGSSRHVFRSGDFDAPDLAGRRKGRRVSVCIPARNEEATVGAIVATVVGACTAAGGGPDLVDEVLVVDDGSTDATAAVARGAGALVVSGQGAGGKGEAMALGAARAGGELLVFLDADVEAFTPSFVVGLLGPLVLDDDIVLVKGFYERPLHGAPSGGGRVTELMARPVIDLLFPQLAFVRQPLAGETAIRRTALEKTGIAPGYGAELGLLVDVTREFGVDALAEVDLGTRVHRNRPLSELRHHATDVLRCALERAPR
ncbi:MAG TPA: glucosyl-3-phosphoglycerate synthase [Acidimicrobiales bacterium]|nr:glucosyl-3-phosphoglycerate synthase [Acidimicrobiales bacterium]